MYPKSSLSSNVSGKALQLIETPDQAVWICYADGSVFRITPDFQITRMTTADGLNDDGTCAFTLDATSLIFETNRALGSRAGVDNDQVMDLSSTEVDGETVDRSIAVKTSVAADSTMTLDYGVDAGEFTTITAADLALNPPSQHPELVPGFWQRPNNVYAASPTDLKAALNGKHGMIMIQGTYVDYPGNYFYSFGLN